MLKERYCYSLRIFLPFFALLLLQFSAMGQDDGEELFSRGFSMMMDERYEEAIPIWEQLLEKKPESSHLHYLLGASYHRSSDRKLEGIPHFEKALENAVPQSQYRPRYDHDEAPLDAHYYLADLYHLDYRFEAAIEHYKLFRQKASEEVVENVPAPVSRKLAMCQNGKELKADPVPIEVQNLGPKINSEYKEHSPAINLDETTLYFTSRRLRPDSSNEGRIDPETGEYYEDIYVSYKEDGEWQEPRLLDLNSEDHEASINLSKDARRLFIYKDERGSGNIYESERLEDSLSEAKKLGDHVNSDAYETHLDISAESDVLYFSSDREGGEGGKDLYQVKKLPTGEWAKPQNLGPTINTPYDEDGPFIHPDGKTLYFSSEGHNSMGGFDIFRTRQKENGVWEDPENIGYPVNSPEDDIYFVTTPDGKRAYYSSDFKGLETEGTGKIEGYGNSDIYMLEFPEFEETRLALLKGFLRPGNCEELLPDIRVVVEREDDNELVQQLKPRSRDGGYVAILPPGDSYRIRYLRGSELFYEEKIEIEEGSEYQEIQRAIHLDTLNFDCSEGRMALMDPDKERVEEGERVARIDERKTEERESKEAEQADKVEGKGAEGKGEDTEKGTTDRPSESGEESGEAGEKGSSGKGKAEGDKLEEEEKDPASSEAKKGEKGTEEGGEGYISTAVVEGFGYKQHFDYNENELTTDEEGFSSFIERVVERAEASDDRLSLRVEASASRVPTGKYKGNRDLARVRAEDAVKKIERALRAEGIGPGECVVDMVEQAVQGPTYGGDAKEAKEKYREFQYVRISLLK